MLSRRDALAALAAPLLPLTPGATEIMDWDAEDRLGREAMKWLAKYGAVAVVLRDSTFDDEAGWTMRPHGLRLIKQSALEKADGSLLASPPLR